MLGLFVTGTDTDVGKTHVAAMIVRALVSSGQRVGVYKPVASGCWREGNTIVSDDAVMLWEAAGKPGDLEAVCPQRFLAPIAPHRAAAAEGQSVDSDLLRSGLNYWDDKADVVVVEGAGGLLSPLSDEDYNADLAVDLGFPLLVVAANRLGVLNATLQTLVTAKSVAKGLPVVGVVLNQCENRPKDASLTSNAEELSARCDAPLLSTVGFNANQCANQFATPVDWLSLMGGSI